MNVKAERIEQIIQTINRSLSCIYSGQSDGLIGLEVRELQRVEAAIFGHDKFAYEMVHYLKAAAIAADTADPDEAATDVKLIWDNGFAKGLETLLVECALVTDDIERDCFVSRVYCWFMEKLSERKDLPRNEFTSQKAKLARSKIVAEGAHSLKGLNTFGLEDSTRHGLDRNNDELLKNIEEPSPGRAPLPNIIVPEKKSKFGARNVPMYVKSGYPAVLPTSNSQRAMAFLPQIPDADDNYGMIYNKPETEAEKNMQELWMARRRQEAFDWKTQQHLALVMDRLALHKSRLETDALRRKESSNNTQKPRPLTTSELGNAHLREESPTKTNPMLCKFSGQRATSSGDRRLQKTRNIDSDDDRSEASPMGKTTLLINSSSGAQAPALIATPGRTSVMQTEKETQKAKRDSFVPMRFGSSLPSTYGDTGNNSSGRLSSRQLRGLHHESDRDSRGMHYLQVSDSDDDDVPDRPPPTGPGRAGGKGKGGKGKKAAPKIEVPQFKRERPVIRERPVSAKQLRIVSSNDPELKVHYRHSNYRRMPLTEDHEKWIEDREVSRTKVCQDMATQLAEAAAAKAAKKKGGKDKGGDKKDKKDKKDKGAIEEKPPVVCPYRDANHYMSTHFPDYEGGLDPETAAFGPMRQMQLLECDEIMDVVENWGSEKIITEKNLRTALLIPQDRPEAICLENLKEESEGLMVNPLPRELWRKGGAGKGKKGKGKKGKKKK